MKIVYRSKNGYMGIMYGRSSFSIRDIETGMEIFHTGRRAFTTYSDMKERVEGFPEFLKMLRDANGLTGVKYEDRF